MPRGIVPRQPAKTGRQEGAQAIRTKLKPVTGESFRAKAKKSVKAPTDSKSKGKCSRYNPLDPNRISSILQSLDKLYPDVKCALDHADAWQLLVATILSAQSTDVNVNRVTPELFRKYPTVQDFARITPEQLQPDIYSTGFFRNKAKSVVGAAQKIVNEFDGKVPCEMDKLLTIPGVARKTANVVLGSWFNIADGVVVDTHVTRISRRLELTKETDPKKIEQDLMKVIPREKWILFSHQIIWHGRKICFARSPKCVDCPLETLCHAADKTWSTVEIHKSAKP